MFKFYFEVSVKPVLLLVSIIFFPVILSAQTVTVTGSVYDSENGEPLVGANVYVSGTSEGTSTGPDGAFSLVVPSEVEVLTVSYIGYRTEEIEVGQNVMIYLDPSVSLEEVIIQGVRADANTPVTESTLYRQEIQQVYNGEQPVFILENLTPSVFSYSESGTKLANYGSMRLRGIGQERINMTLNGVPLNDMIDHGVFFSNFTDIGNSFESVQVQRGVGTSSNGVASYAGSVNFESVSLENREQGGQVELGLGSFNSYRMNTSVSSGMVDDRWSFYGSYSRILSDGYRYNTGTNAYSFFFSGGHFGERDMVKINAFDARSKNGLGYSAVAESDLQNDMRTNYLNENDKDDFGQRFVQLQYTRLFSELFSANASLYYGGASGDFLYTYADTDSTLAQINYPLENDHYGLMMNAFLETGDWSVSSGIHGYIFERINEESVAPDFENPYYRETSDKKELSWFGKVEWRYSDLLMYADLQIRTATLSIQPDYDFIGIAPEGEIGKNWTFVNPKVGASYQLSEQLTAYASLGRTGREPTKIDIIGGFNLGAANYSQARSDQFSPEQVTDLEAGLTLNSRRLAVSANYFYMDFKDEIAPIGEVIAFGVQRRNNIPRSYRTGVELEWNYLPVDLLSFRGNLMFMKSEIDSFTDGGGTTYRNKTPILSPEWIVNAEAGVSPIHALTFRLAGNFVGESFLELTNDSQFMLPSYFVVDASVSYDTEKVSVRLELNNLTDKHYYSSGSPVDLDFDGMNDEPGYFVNGGRNVFLTTTVRF